MSFKLKEAISQMRTMISIARKPDTKGKCRLHSLASVRQSRYVARFSKPSFFPEVEFLQGTKERVHRVFPAFCPDKFGQRGP